MARPGTLTCIRVSPECAAAPAACWRRCGVTVVSTFIVTCVPSSCSLRELLLAMSRCEVLGRDSPGRVGWISLAVVALGREMVTPACPSGVAARHSAALCPPPPAWRATCQVLALGYCHRAVRRVRGCRGYGSAIAQALCPRTIRPNVMGLKGPG